MDYIIEFKKREQYDCEGDSIPKSVARTFDETATLKEITDWVRDEAGFAFNDYNILTNPQIIGILMSRENECKIGATEEPVVCSQQDSDGNWHELPKPVMQ